MDRETVDQCAERLVRQEVNCCLSSLVATLASGYGRELSVAGTDLSSLVEQAFELASPVDDWEEAASQEGYEVRHDLGGFYVCTNDEGEHEDDGNPSVGFDGRPHYETAAEAWKHAVSGDVYQREVFEHWSVSSFLADRLLAQGEKVDKDFGGLCAWARTTTGQGIANDSCIQAIAREIVEGRV